MNDTAGDRRSGLAAREPRAYWLVFAIVWMLLVLPPLVVRYAPLHDFPNHLARAFILGNIDRSSFLARFYSTEWLPYPNLAIDLTVPPLTWVMSAEHAGRVFLVLLPTMFLCGADRVARAFHGRASWSVPLAAFFFFNTLYFYGFVNFIFGLGLYLLVLALWLAYHRAPTLPRLLGLMVSVVACYIAHKTALAFLAVSIVCTLFVDRKALAFSKLARHAAIFIPVLLILLTSKVPTVAGAIEWESPLGKAKGLASLSGAYHPIWDFASTAVFVVLLLVIARGGSRVNRAALLTAAAMGVLFVIFPTGLGGTWAADRRFVLPAAVLAILALDPNLEHPRVRAAWAAALALVCVRAAIVLHAWVGLSADIAARVAILDRVPVGARVFGFALVDRKNKAMWPREMRLVYLHHYAAIDREACVNGLFTFENQQPLRLREKYEIPQRPELGLPPARVDWATIFSNTDYVFATKIDAAYRAFLQERCEIAHERDDTVLYQRCRT